MPITYLDEENAAPAGSITFLEDEPPPSQPLGETAVNQLKRGFLQLATKPLQAIGNTQQAAIDLAGQAPVVGPAWKRALEMLPSARWALPIVKEVEERRDEMSPVDTRNKKTATVAGVVPQVMGMISTGGVGGAAAALGLGGAMGAQQGFETADEIGVTSPAGKLATAAAFAGVEAGIERLGGIGGKEVAGSLVKRALKGAASETLEEPVTGIAQDAITYLAADEDPNAPGRTATGYDLAQLSPYDPRYWSKRRYEALGGAVGGTMFAGYIAASAPKKPGSVTFLDEPTDSAPGTPDLQEHTGDLTADDVVDLEAVEVPAAPPPLETPSSETALTPKPPQTITGSNVQTGTEMPVQPPTVPAGAEAGVAPVAAWEDSPDFAHAEALAMAGDIEGADAIEAAWQQSQSYVVPPSGSQETTPPAQAGTTQQAPADSRAAATLRASNASLPATAQAKWTPEVYAAAETYFAGGNEAALQGLTPIQKKRVIQARLDADPVARAEQEARDMAAEKELTKQETSEARITKRDNLRRARAELWADEVIDDARGRVSAGIDPKLMAAYTIKGTRMLLDGARDFATWSKAMVQKFGAAILDYLQGVWQAAMKTSQQGFVGTGTTPKVRETQSRFARPDEAERMYQTRADADVKAAALAWVDSVSLDVAVAQLESGSLPEGMTDDVGQRAAAEVLMRAGELMRSGTEVQKLQARSLSHRMGKVWQGWMSQEAGRNLRQRAVANAELQPFAPILAAENVLIDRADAVVRQRFEGGSTTGAQKVKKVADDSGKKAGENLGADLDAEEQPARPGERQTREPTSKKHPALARMLNDLRRKMFPGMKWADIFTELPSAQKERQRAIYQRLQLDERLKGLSADERLALTNELDKAWQRERRKVFNRELEKAGVLGEKDASDRAKVQKAMPRLLRMINLGMMNSEMFREAIAPEYGLRMLSGDEALKLRTLAEDAWKLPEGVLRNRKLGELLAGIQKATGASTAELLNHYWVASVLSGLRTIFDTFMSSMNGFGNNLIQAGHLIATGRGKAAAAAHLQWWRGLSDGVSESLQILTKGDYSYLKRFNEDMRRALDGEGTFRPVPLGESLWKNGNWWQKYGMAPVMIWTGRLMAAADHINNTATSQGAMATARALHPELYQGANAWTDAERAAARKQALREVTGGTEPTTRADAATISARTREILNGNVSPETRAEGNFIGDQAAYQNDPIGILGGVYQMMNAGLGMGERSLQILADKIGTDGRAGAFAKAALTFAAGAARSVAGAKFIRFGANFGNDMMGYMPGTYLLSRAGQSLDLIERTRSQNALLLGKNVFGLVAASTVAAMFADKDDDEDGWHMEGSWNGMTPERKAQRRTAGMEPLSFWKRDGSKVQRLSYRSWPTAGIFAAVGSMADERRFDPVKFKSRGVAGHLLHAVTAGALQVKDVNAVRDLAELFGASAISADPEADFMERLLKLPLNYIGGAVPTAVKDLDALRDPRMYQPDGAFEELARNVPGVRQQVSGGRPKLNKLGEPIELDRKPWSRAYTNMESGSAHRVLGSLLARGLDLPSASSDRMVFSNGSRVSLKSLGGDVEYKYQKRVGDGYKTWLASDEGRALLTMPVEQAAKVIERKATTIKMMAALAATGN